MKSKVLGCQIVSIFFTLVIYSSSFADSLKSPALQERERPTVGWTLGLESDVYVIKDEAEKTQIHINTSHFFARFNGEGNGKTKYSDLFDFENSMTGVSFVVEVSTLPNVLSDDVEEALTIKVDERLEQARPRISQLVTLAAQSNPAFQLLPAHVQQQIIHQRTQEQIDSIRTQRLAQNSQRQSHVEDELTIQQITIGAPFDMGSLGVGFLKLGKEKSEAHPLARDHTRVTTDPAKVLGSTGGTGFVAIGNQFTTSDGFVVTSEVRVFSERPAYFEAFDYLARYINASESDYKRYQNILSLNSVAGKIVASTGDGRKQGGIYVADHAGERGTELTLWGKLMITDSLTIDLTSFRGQNDLRASSIVLEKQISPMLSAYMRHTKVHGFDEPTTSERENTDYSEFVVGSAFRFATFRVWEVDCDSLVKLELAHRDGYLDSRQWDPAVGAHINCQ